MGAGIYYGLLALGTAIAAPLAAIGVGIGEGLLFSAALQGVARQPEAQSRITGLMWLAFGLVETLFIFCFVIFLMLLVKLPSASVLQTLLQK